MSVVHPGIFSLMKRFPAKKDVLRRLYLHSHSFQNLCDDYRICKEALDHWTHSSHDQAAERSRDYHELLLGLESEIKACIDVAWK